MAFTKGLSLRDFHSFHFLLFLYSMHSAMSRYPSCLHPPLFSSQISSYSSLAGALKTESPRTLDFNNPRRRRIPQYKGGASCGHATLSPPILFDHFGALGQGVRVQHFIILSTNALLKEIGGAEDQILTGLKANHILLKMNVCAFWKSLSIWRLISVVAGIWMLELGSQRPCQPIYLSCPIRSEDCHGILGISTGMWSDFYVEHGWSEAYIFIFRTYKTLASPTRGGWKSSVWSILTKSSLSGYITFTTMSGKLIWPWIFLSNLRPLECIFFFLSFLFGFCRSACYLLIALQVSWMLSSLLSICCHIVFCCSLAFNLC